MSSISSGFLSALPSEIRTQILCRVDYKSLRNLRCISKNPYVLNDIKTIMSRCIIRDNALPILELHKHKQQVATSPLKAYFSEATLHRPDETNSFITENVKELTLVDATALSFKTLPAVMKTLTIVGKSSFSEEHLGLLPADLQSLLIWNRCKWILSTTKCVFPSNLITLDLRFNKSLENFDCFPEKLKVLRLDSNEHIRDVHIEMLPSGLTHLNLTSAIHLTDACAEKLPKNLIHLNIAKNIQLTNDFVEKSSPGIKRLILSKNPLVTASIEVLKTHRYMKVIHTVNGVAVFNSPRKPFQIKESYVFKTINVKYKFKQGSLREDYIFQPVGSLNNFYSVFDLDSRFQSIVYQYLTERRSIKTVAFNGTGKCFDNEVSRASHKLGIMKLDKTYQGEFEGLSFKRGLIVGGDKFYFGPVVKGKLDGICFFYDREEGVYCGGFKNGLRHGFGILLANDCRIEKFIYEKGEKKKHSSFSIFTSGEYRDESYPEGVSMIYKLPGTIWFGKFDPTSFTEGMLCDKGEFYDGQFLGRRKSGMGTLWVRNGDRYEGEFHANKIHGQGVYIYDDGRRYKGSFVKGLKDGFGTLIFKDGTIYEGRFKKDKFDGEGEYKLSDGSILRYDFNDPYYGIIKYPNEDIYKGGLEGLSRDGKGELKFASGKIFRGMFENNKPYSSIVDSEEEDNSTCSIS